jgi:hypothetical protein
MREIKALFRAKIKIEAKKKVALFFDSIEKKNFQVFISF